MASCSSKAPAEGVSVAARYLRQRLPAHRDEPRRVHGYREPLHVLVVGAVGEGGGEVDQALVRQRGKGRKLLGAPQHDAVARLLDDVERRRLVIIGVLHAVAADADPGVVGSGVLALGGAAPVDLRVADGVRERDVVLGGVAMEDRSVAVQLRRVLCQLVANIVPATDDGGAEVRRAAKLPEALLHPDLRVALAGHHLVVGAR